jgi:hypothetical protein
VTCRTAVGDDWYLVPGILRKKADGVISPVSMADPPVFESGIGAVTGAMGGKAIYLRGGAANPVARFYTQSRNSPDRSLQHSFIAYGGLERRIALKEWRGKRISVTVRLKDEGEARAFVSAWMNKSNGTAIRTAARPNKAGGALQMHQFVLDVPENATSLAIMVGLTGKGTAWLDGMTMMVVDRAMPLSWSERLEGNQYPNSDYFNSSTSPPVPGPVRHDES